MARIILNTSTGNPHNRLETLQRLFGDDAVIVDRDVPFRGEPVTALKDAVVRVEIEARGAAMDAGMDPSKVAVVGIIVPQNVLGDIGTGAAIREDILVLREDFLRGENGRVVVAGQDANGRDILQVGGYSRLKKAELVTEPVTSGALSVTTGRVLAVSRHNPEGRQEAVDAAFGQPMDIIVEDVPFDGRPRDAIGGAIARLSGVDAILVPKAVLKDLRFGDALGEVPILTEVFAGAADAGQATAFAGREDSGRDRFTVTGLARFIRAELVMEEVKPAN